MNNNKKEAFKQFLKELVENKYTRERLKEVVDLEIEGLEEEEVCIEPFAFIEPMEAVEPIYDFKTFSDAICDLDADGDIEISEDEIKFDPPFVEFTEEELEYYNSLTEDLKPVDGLSVLCNVNGEERMLCDGINCNIKPIPLLSINLVSPVNLKITKVTLTSDMATEEEIEIDFVVEVEQNLIKLKSTLGNMAQLGILAVIDEDEFELVLSPVGFRGITKAVDVEEFI